jgi:predicted DNA-binding helix-hairpin-helix protein
VEANTAAYETLLKVPGVGVISAKRIVSARKTGKLTFDNLKKLGVALKRAKYFLTCGGKMLETVALTPETLSWKLSENKISQSCEQMDFSDYEAERAAFLPALSPTREDAVKCLTGQL